MKLFHLYKDNRTLFFQYFIQLFFFFLVKYSLYCSSYKGGSSNEWEIQLKNGFHAMLRQQWPLPLEVVFLLNQVTFRRLL